MATLESVPGKDTHWSRASMAARTGLSKSTIGQIREKSGLKPPGLRQSRVSSS